MASGRVDAEPPILKTLQSPQIRGGVTLPLPLPAPWLGQLFVPGNPSAPLEMFKKLLFFQRFRVRGPQGSPKDPRGPPRTPLGSQSGPTWLPRAHPGLPKTPPKTSQRPLRSSKAQKYNKNQWFFNVFRLAHGCS